MGWRWVIGNWCGPTPAERNERVNVINVCMRVIECKSCLRVNNVRYMCIDICKVYISCMYVRRHVHKVIEFNIDVEWVARMCACMCAFLQSQMSEC